MRELTFSDDARAVIEDLHSSRPQVARQVLRDIARFRAGHFDGKPLEERPSSDLSDCFSFYAGVNDDFRVVDQEDRDGTVTITQIIVVMPRAAAYEAALLGLGRIEPGYRRSLAERRVDRALRDLLGGGR